MGLLLFLFLLSCHLMQGLTRLPFDMTPLFSSFGQPSLSEKFHVDSPIYFSKKVMILSDLLDTTLNLNLLPCPLPQTLKWVVKLLLVVRAPNGILHNVKCKVCSTINRKPCLRASKWDILTKHEGKGKAKKNC